MRKVVMVFAAAAAAKVWTQDRFYRSVMQDALVQAYRERAAQLCQKESQKPGKATLSSAWLSGSTAEVTIGAPGMDVAVWDLENPLWDVRFRHPHLVLTASGGTKTRCTYDLAVGLVNVSAR